MEVYGVMNTTTSLANTKFVINPLTAADVKLFIQVLCYVIFVFSHVPSKLLQH
jgi:hypothetical protein